MVNEWLAVGFPTARRLCQSRPVTSRLSQVRFGNLPFPHLQPDLDQAADRFATSGRAQADFLFARRLGQIVGN
jgi:hypothetical protein